MTSDYVKVKRKCPTCGAEYTLEVRADVMFDYTRESKIDASRCSKTVYESLVTGECEKCQKDVSSEFIVPKFIDLKKASHKVGTCELCGEALFFPRDKVAGHYKCNACGYSNQISMGLTLKANEKQRMNEIKYLMKQLGINPDDYTYEPISGSMRACFLSEEGSNKGDTIEWLYTLDNYGNLMFRENFLSEDRPDIVQSFFADGHWYDAHYDTDRFVHFKYKGGWYGVYIRDYDDTLTIKALKASVTGLEHEVVYQGNFLVDKRNLVTSTQIIKYCISKLS